MSKLRYNAQRTEARDPMVLAHDSHGVSKVDSAWSFPFTML